MTDFHLPAAYPDPEVDMGTYHYTRPILTLLILVLSFVMLAYLHKHHPQPFYFEQALPFDLEMCTPAHVSVMHEGNP